MKVIEIDGFLIERMVFQYIIKVGLIEEFIANCHLLDAVEDEPITSIDMAFSWSDTNEGTDFWSTVNGKFYSFVADIMADVEQLAADDCWDWAQPEPAIVPAVAVGAKFEFFINDDGNITRKKQAPPDERVII